MPAARHAQTEGLLLPVCASRAAGINPAARWVYAFHLGVKGRRHQAGGSRA